MGETIINSSFSNDTQEVLKAISVIRNNILHGKYPEGSRINLYSLSEDLGFGNPVLQDAVQQLEKENLTKLTPDGEVVVLGITPSDIKDIYSIRMLIEGLASRWAAEKISAADIQELEEVIDLMKIYTDKNDIPQLLKMDSRFHNIIFKASRSRPLMLTLSTFHNYILRARNSSFQTPGRVLKAFEEHKAIYQAIVDRNPSKAEQLTYEHVRKAGENLLSQLK